MIVALILRDVLATVMVIAAGAKAVDVAGFGKTLAALGLYRLDSRLRPALAAAVIVAEGALGLATAAGIWPHMVDFANVAITAGFVVVTALGLVRGVLAQCRCFGALSGTAFTAGGLVRALALFAIALTAAILGYPGTPPSAQAVLIVAGYGILAAAAAQASAVLQSVRVRRA
jgi:methylamine utilization protein MauE